MAALEVNHVTGFPEGFFPLRSLSFPLDKPTLWESTGKGVVKRCVFYYFFGPSSANPRSALSLVSSRGLAEEEAAESAVAEGITQTEHSVNSVKFGY